MQQQKFRTAVFPGSFDPFTIGHESVVKRALSIFDKVVIGIGENTTKTSFFPLEKRIEGIKKVFEDMSDKVEVKSYKGLTVDFCRSENAGFILRGLRTAADFEYERAIGQMNKTMKPELETVFLLTSTEYTPVNSTIVRDIIIFGGDASKFLPKGIDIKKYL